MTNAYIILAITALRHGHTHEAFRRLRMALSEANKEKHAGRGDILAVMSRLRNYRPIRHA